MKVLMIPKNHEYIERLRSSLEKKGVSVRILKPFHYSSPANLAKMILCRLSGCRLIHVHWLYIFPFGLVMKSFYYLCKFLKIKIVWEMHNIVPHRFTRAGLKNSAWFYEHADAIIFHGKSDVGRAKELLGTSKDKPHIVIPHGNFNESYENRISKKEARRILNIPAEGKVVLCFGWIRRNRGYEHLIGAAKDLKDVTVLVAGKVEEKNIYEDLLSFSRKSPNLKVYGRWIPDKEIQVFFNACDFVVLPYTDITTSGVIPLAYAFSRPVISTAIGGISDVVNDKTGILVHPGDAAALREGIEAMFTRDLDAMGGYCREYAENTFDWGKNAAKIASLYELVQGNGH